MNTIPIEQGELRKLIKDSIVEVLRERRDLLENIFIDALEDIRLKNNGLARAIEEGLNTPKVDEAEVFAELERKK